MLTVALVVIHLPRRVSLAVLHDAIALSRGPLRLGRVGKSELVGVVQNGLQVALLRRTAEAAVFTFGTQGEASDFCNRLAVPGGPIRFAWNAAGGLVWAAIVLAFGAATTLWGAPRLGLPLVALSLVLALLGHTHSALFGADGIVVESLFRQRFIPFRRVASVRPYGGWRGTWMRIRGDDGSRWVLPAVPSTLYPIFERLIVNVKQGLPDADPALEAWLSPPPERDSIQAWKSQLQRRFAGDYRTKAVPIAALLQHLESPAAEAESRIGAAVALSLVPGQEKALRRVQHITVDPSLQAALDGLVGVPEGDA